MTIFCLDILLHGIIPAVTGGFYYNLYTTPLANTVHIYLWICFMTLPLLLYLVGLNQVMTNEFDLLYLLSVYTNQSAILLYLSISDRDIIFYDQISELSSA